MNIRFKYERGEELKYLAHLDMMTLFERALKRARVSVGYSTGFNKRPLMVFGLPISSGMISRAEYTDIVLSERLECEHFISRMNETLPEGAKIISAKELAKGKNIMSAVVMARYSIELKSRCDIAGALKNLMEAEEIYVSKEKKGRMIQKEIRSGIREAEWSDGQIFLMLKSGQNGHIKPEEFVQALQTFADEDIQILEIIREEIYIENEQNVPVPAL